METLNDWDVKYAAKLAAQVESAKAEFKKHPSPNSERNLFHARMEVESHNRYLAKGADAEAVSPVWFMPLLGEES